MTEEREVNSASFYQFIAEKKLMASRCKKCQALYLPPHPICVKCYGNEMEWVEMKGKGQETGEYKSGNTPNHRVHGAGGG